MTLPADKVMVEVLRNRFQAIAEEMATILLKAGHTVFVKETGDFGSAVVSLGGEVVSAPLNIGANIVVGMPMAACVAASQALGEEEGDIFFVNDPEASKGLSTHLPDLFLWKPIFRQGRPICYAMGFIHSSDCGGRVPGSIAPSSVEIFEEGIRVPPIKILRRGEVNREFLDLYFLNVRIPDQNWGDIKAIISALNTAEKRVHSLCDRYGEESVAAGIDAVLDYAESEARSIIAKVPDGEYVFWDYMEGDHVGCGMVRLKLRLVKQGGDMTLDFGETDHQVRFPINLASHNQTGHWMVVHGVVNWLRTMAPESTYNSGLVRPLRLKVPPGNLLNPEPTAAVGMRAATMLRLADVFSGALALAVDDVIPAAGSGQSSMLLVSVPDLNTGKPVVNVVQPLCGGSGARPFKDGIDGIDILMGALRNIPTESLETEMPGVMVTHYGLRPGSGGAGRWRGGCGVELELRIFPPYAAVVSRNMERYIMRPWGRMGGEPGAPGRTVLNPGTPGEKELGKLDVFYPEPGDVLRIYTQGGGGYGNPLDREPERVLTDVRNGLVSPDQARSDYGVVMQADAVDTAATDSLRAAMRREQAPPEPFAFGPERLEYERRWPDSLQTALNRKLAQYPMPIRTFLRDRTRQTIDIRAAQGQQPTEAMIDDIIAGLKASFQMRVPGSDPTGGQAVVDGN